MDSDGRTSAGLDVDRSAAGWAELQSPLRQLAANCENRKRLHSEWSWFATSRYKLRRFEASTYAHTYAHSLPQVESVANANDQLAPNGVEDALLLDALLSGKNDGGCVSANQSTQRRLAQRFP